jgi:hypothetical protein
MTWGFDIVHTTSGAAATATPANIRTHIVAHRPRFESEQPDRLTGRRDDRRGGGDTIEVPSDGE